MTVSLAHDGHRRAMAATAEPSHCLSVHALHACRMLAVYVADLPNQFEDAIQQAGVLLYR